jgi:hypothetical protein
MPAPSGSVIKTMIISFYGMQLGPDAEKYLDKLTSEIEKSWSDWQKNMKFGTIQVTGGGVGAWSGIGAGGLIQAQPFIMKPFPFGNNSKELFAFTSGVCQALSTAFDPWPLSFKFSGINYVGSSAATPTSPGPVNASNVPVPLASAGSGKNPSGIGKAIESNLKPPDFDLSSPLAQAGKLSGAVGDAIEQAFQTNWLLGTMVSGNTISNAPGSPGGVVAGFPSTVNGKLV